MTIPGAYSLVLRDQHLSLLPQRAIFWREEKTLIVADVHLGKAQTFQRAGIAVPAQSFHHDLQRLADLIENTSAQRLLVLGDFVHHRSGLTARVVEDIQRWSLRLSAELVVVLGNHDKPNKTVLEQLPITLCEPAWQRGPFIFAHDNMEAEEFRFFGHIHPVVNLPQMRLPVFAIYQDYCVLPAFSYFTGGAPASPQGLLQIFAPLEETGSVVALPVMPK
ncbi:MAG: ligase-associated DNA damage response endonuclease PdeM [Cellvibrionaceae bacterium]|nr:ligase-associated DNA damage response endonuclease PdeM [Cellvibrionaceae bacterium]